MGKKKKRKKRNSKLLKILIFIILIAIAIIFALVSPIFNIETITVQGNEKIDSDTIISISGLEVGNNIFKCRSGEIEKNIKEEPYIESAKMKRRIPGTIEITVIERKIAYQINIIDGFIYIDDEGYILEKSSEMQKIPILEGFKTTQENLLNGKRLCSDDLNYLNTVLKIVNASKNLDIYESITKIIIENNEFVLYFQNENKYAYLGNGTEITNKMTYVKAIMQKESNSGKIFVNGDINGGFKPYFREE